MNDATGPATVPSALLEEDLEDLYESAPCGYLSVAPNGTVVKVNRTFLGWIGLERDDVLGRRRWQDLLAPGDRIFYETHLAPSLRLQGQVREIALDIQTGDGQRFPVLVNAVMKLDDEGQPLVTRVVLLDARERRRYEEELLAARSQAQQAQESAAKLARTLQQSLLPHALPEVPGLDIGAAYRPAGDGSEVGGDFYDVIELPCGSWGFVLGDVCGKGAEAAVLTALARGTVRNEVLRSDSPGQVLRGVRDVFLRYHPEQYCTAVMMTIAPHESGATAHLASGGHLPPLRRRANGEFDQIGEPGAILGLVLEGDISETVGELHSGEVVALFTDGITEARREGEFFDVEGLRRAIDAVAGGTAQQIADAVVASALEFQRGDASDDMAVVVVRVP